MPTTDPRVDAYIKRAAPFAKPILVRIRKAVHAGCPDVREEMKWSVPHFTYKGMLCAMAAYKAHCMFGFWKHKLLADAGLLEPQARSLGRYGKIASVSELPSDTALIRIVKAAVKLNDAGVTVPRAARRKKPPVKTPPALMRALRKSPAALAAYRSFSPSHKREYVEWIGEAKGADTRQKRLDSAVAMMAEGKSRNWKYART
jgi:uncharacterized protein YdeI (YjbR/CyaY-like superfamily)